MKHISLKFSEFLNLWLTHLIWRTMENMSYYFLGGHPKFPISNWTLFEVSLCHYSFLFICGGNVSIPVFSACLLLLSQLKPGNSGNFISLLYPTSYIIITKRSPCRGTYFSIVLWDKQFFMHFLDIVKLFWFIWPLFFDCWYQFFLKQHHKGFKRFYESGQLDMVWPYQFERQARS